MQHNCYSRTQTVSQNGWESNGRYSISPKNFWIPGWLIYPIAVLNELFAYLIRPIKRINPKVSRFAITYICTDFTINGDKARRDFGFAPKYDVETAVERSAAWFKKHGPVKSS